MDALTLMLMVTGILIFFLVLFVFLFLIIPPRVEKKDDDYRAIKEQVEEEVVSETAPYKMRKKSVRYGEI